MRHLHCYIVKPFGKRYSNKKDIDGQELILNTSIENHKFVNRIGVVIETPIVGENYLNKGDKVIVHHNVFRRFWNVKGKEQNSRSFFKEDLYFCYYDQIFLYNRDNKWDAPRGYCFVNPLKNKDKYNINKEKPLTGVLKYLSQEIRDFGLKENDIIGFTPNSEYEFVIDNQRLYRVPTNSISIKYGHKKDEAEYNPEWL